MKIWVAWHKNRAEVNEICGGLNGQTLKTVKPCQPAPECRGYNGLETEWREFESVGVLSLPVDKTQSKLARIRAILEEKD